MMISDLQHELAWFEEWFKGEIRGNSLANSLTTHRELGDLKKIALAAWEEGARREAARSTANGKPDSPMGAEIRRVVQEELQKVVGLGEGE